MPLVFAALFIQAFWDKQGGALQKRWPEPRLCRGPLRGARRHALHHEAGSRRGSSRQPRLRQGARHRARGRPRLPHAWTDDGACGVPRQAALDELAVLQDRGQALRGRRRDRHHR